MSLKSTHILTLKVIFASSARRYFEAIKLYNAGSFISFGLRAVKLFELLHSFLIYL